MSAKDIYSGPRAKYVSFWRRTRPRSIVYALLVFPVYLLSRALPKSNHEVFGSYNGQAIGDNSVHEFLHSKTQKKYFVTKSRRLAKTPFSGFLPLYCYSPTGIWIQLTAKSAYFCHTVDDLFAPAVMGARVVALGHGVPIKKSAMADKKLAWIRRPLPRFLTLVFFPYLYHYYCTEVQSSSKFFDSYKLEVYGFSNPKVVRSNMARLPATSTTPKDGTRFIYAPTFRKHSQIQDTVRRAGLFNPELEVFLSKLGAELFIKPHYLDEEQAVNLVVPNRVRVLFTHDINQDLAGISGLITDYSSIFYDAAVQGIDVALVNSDLDEYMEKDTELFDWYETISRDFGQTDLLSAINQLTSSGGIDFHEILEAEE